MTTRSESRKQNRLDVWDYSEDGYYFVTVCIEDHREIFGKVVNEEMVLSEYGKIVWECWKEILDHFENVELDEFIVMPNHVHGIIIIGCDPENFQINGVLPVGDAYVGTRHALSLPGNRKYQKLPVIIGSFKSAVTHRINMLQPELKFRWQRSFYDHIIRGEKTLERIREYVRYNAIKWELDQENPLNLKS